MRQGFAIRLLAMLFDTLIFLAVLALISAATTGDPLILLKLAGEDEQAERAAEEVGVLFLVLIVVAFLAYWFSEIYMAASPGKLALGLRIGDENGRPATLRQLAARWLAKNSGGLIQMIGDFAGARPILIAGNVAALCIVFGCFMVLGRSRQALHDTLAGTAVFKKSYLRAAGHRIEAVQPASPPPTATGH
jgi:uncharacterized RDD family membrane protein YckC